jgi:hypothetical protein
MASRRLKRAIVVGLRKQQAKKERKIGQRSDGLLILVIVIDCYRICEFSLPSLVR